MSEEKGSVTVRLPVEIQKKLDRIAAGKTCSRNQLINEAIETYLDVHAWQEKKIRARLKKAEQGRTFRTGKQVDKVVDSFIFFVPLF